LLLSSLVLTFAATAALPSDYQAYPPSHSNAVYAQHRHGIRLPKELKIVWRQEERPAMKALPKEQRRGWLRARWESMSDQQRQTKIAELEAKWNAIPANVRQSLLEKKRQKHEAKRMQKAEARHNDSGDASQPVQQ
jgi:hypothetical protein